MIRKGSFLLFILCTLALSAAADNTTIETPQNDGSGETSDPEQMQKPTILVPAEPSKDESTGDETTTATARPNKASHRLLGVRAEPPSTDTGSVRMLPAPAPANPKDAKGARGPIMRPAATMNPDTSTNDSSPRFNRLERERLLEGVAFKKLHPLATERLQALDAAKLQRLSVLNEQQMLRLANVSSHRLRVLASKDLGSLATLENSELEKAALLDRNRMHYLANLTPEEARAQLQKVRILAANESFMMRPLGMQLRERSEQVIGQLKNREERLQLTYRNNLTALKQLRAQLCLVKENEPAGNSSCMQSPEFFTMAQTAAHDATERLLAHLEELKERVERSEDLSQEAADTHSARLDGLIESVRSIQEEIDAATTQTELNSAVAKLQETVLTVKRISLAKNHVLARARLMGAVQRSEVLEKKLDCSLSALEAQGVDTTAIDTQVEEFSSSLAEARNRLQEAKTLIERGEQTGSTDKSDSFTQVKENLESARASLREAQGTLQSVREAMRALGATACTQPQQIAVVEEAIPGNASPEQDKEQEE